jgi:hypothetical protein
MERIFSILADKWEEDTKLYSFYRIAQAHKSYNWMRKIGKNIVPCILQRLENNPDASVFWCFLLTEIVGEEMDYSSHIRNGYVKFSVDELKWAWILWGRERGYV